MHCWMVVASVCSGAADVDVACLDNGCSSQDARERRDAIFCSITDRVGKRDGGADMKLGEASGQMRAL